MGYTAPQKTCCDPENAQLYGADGMTLDIVIVNWNAGRALSDCVASIPASVEGAVRLQRVVVVDNASTDGSVDALVAEGVPLHSVRNAENVGFARACNQGAAGSEAEYVLFLNPDTLLGPEALRAPLEFLEQPENAQVGIVGIQLVGDSGEVHRSCARFPTPGHVAAKMLGLDRLLPGRFPGFIMDDWTHEDTRPVDHVIGAFFLVRRRLFQELGGFDERFFVYLEDLDFSLRAARAGWRTVYLADVRAYHKGGGTSEQVKAARLFYSLRSRILYGFKHFPAPWALALMLGTLMVEPLTRLGWAGARGSGREALETLQGYGKLWRATPATLAGARRGGAG